MSIPVRNNLDLGNNQLLGALAEVLASDPTGVEGRIVYNSTAGVKRLKWYNGTAWVGALADTTRLDQITAPTASVSLNSQKITGLLDGTAATDAATKGQLDAVSAGLDPKASVRVATTANITLSGTQTIDGVAAIAADRVLVKGQTTGSENGIYAVAAGAWSRTTDADVSAEVNAGMFVFVEEGTADGDSGWVLTTNNPITLGTTALAFVKFSSSSDLTAGAGLTKTGTTLDVIGTANRIAVAADAVDISTSYVGQATITTLGTIATGTWTGTDVAVADGGTGASTAAAARTNLAAVGKYSADITGNGTATQFTVTHSLATTDVQVQVWKATTNAWVIVDIVRVDSNNVRIDFSTAPVNGEVFRVVCQG